MEEEGPWEILDTNGSILFGGMPKNCSRYGTGRWLHKGDKVGQEDWEAHGQSVEEESKIIMRRWGGR